MKLTSGAAYRELHKLLLLPSARTLEEYRGAGYEGGLDAKYLEPILAEVKASMTQPHHNRVALTMDAMNVRSGEQCPVASSERGQRQGMLFQGSL